MSVSVCEGQNGQDNIIWMYSYCWFWSSQAGTHSGGLWGDVQWLASGSPPEPESTLKAPASLDGLGWLWWTWVLKRINLSLIFSLKHLWKPNFCENVCPCKPFYFWHSFWMTLYSLRTERGVWKTATVVFFLQECSCLLMLVAPDTLINLRTQSEEENYSCKGGGRLRSRNGSFLLLPGLLLISI